MQGACTSGQAGAQGTDGETEARDPPKPEGKLPSARWSPSTERRPHAFRPPRAARPPEVSASGTVDAADPRAGGLAWPWRFRRWPGGPAHGPAAAPGPEGLLPPARAFPGQPSREAAAGYPPSRRPSMSKSRWVTGRGGATGAAIVPPSQPGGGGGGDARAGPRTRAPGLAAHLEPFCARSAPGVRALAPRAAPAHARSGQPSAPRAALRTRARSRLARPLKNRAP